MIASELIFWTLLAVGFGAAVVWSNRRPSHARSRGLALSQYRRTRDHSASGSPEPTASTLTNTEWSGKKTRENGEVQLLAVRFYDDGTASFYLYSIPNPRWTRSWKWKQSEQEVTISGYMESYQGTIRGDRIAGTGTSTGVRCTFELTFQRKLKIPQPSKSPS